MSYREGKESCWLSSKIELREQFTFKDTVYNNVLLIPKTLNPDSSDNLIEGDYVVVQPASCYTKFLK